MEADEPPGTVLQTRNLGGERPHLTQRLTGWLQRIDQWSGQYGRVAIDAPIETGTFHRNELAA